MTYRIPKLLPNPIMTGICILIDWKSDNFSVVLRTRVSVTKTFRRFLMAQNN